MIDINYAASYCDATYKYIVTYPEGMTVREFINEWMTVHKNEWGFFKVHHKRTKRDVTCWYTDGEIEKGSGFNEETLNSVISEVNGSGGWSRSDFIIVI